MLALSGLGACALENPQVIVAPTSDAATDVGSVVDVTEPIDRPTPVDLGIAIDVVTPVDRPPTVDAGRDAGVVDTGPVDVGTPDTGAPDTGTPDAGNPDVGVMDVGVPDAGSPDAGVPDVPTVVDSGTVDVPLDPTCGADRQRCCSGASCRSGLTCVNPGVAFCTPCGGDFQVCCGGGACNRGPCRGGFCTVF